MRIRVERTWYPIDLSRLVTILPDPDVTPVPKAPADVAGLLIYEGFPVAALWPGERTEEPCRCAVLVKNPKGGLCGYLGQEVDMDGEAEEEVLGAFH